MLRGHGGRRQTANLAMASPQDAFAFQKRKLIRAGLPVFGRDRDKPGDRPVVVGDEDGLAVAHLFDQRTALIFDGGHRSGFHPAIIATMLSAAPDADDPISCGARLFASRAR